MAMIVSSQLVCLLPVGTFNHHMFFNVIRGMLFIYYLFSLFVYMADALCRRLSSTRYARILAHLFFREFILRWIVPSPSRFL